MSHIKYAQELIDSFNLTPPVDPYYLCEHFDIEIVSRMLEGAEAIFLIQNAKKKIILNDMITNPTRRKFTLAHELGHYFIPWHETIMYEGTNNYYDDVEEIEANEFASELLIPSKFIKRDLSDYDINFRTLQKILPKYDVSLTAFALKAVTTSREPIAFIMTKDKRITRVFKSNSFNIAIKDQGDYISQYSGSYKLYTQIISGDYFYESINSDVWFLENINEKVIENTMYFPKYNSTLTILKIKKAVYNPFDEIFLDI